MTTSEFIEMLKEADPSGEAHIRMEGGVPRFAELKEGYWDGPYSYINEKGEYVYSTKNLKVDIHCTDIYSFVEDNYSHGVTTWDDIEKLFKFELGYSDKSQRSEREQNILNQAKKCFDDMSESEENMYQKQLSEAKTKASEGYKWFQNKEVDNIVSGHNRHIYYTWVFISPDGNEDTFSNVWKVEPILKSGLWEKLDDNVKEGYYQWVFKK